MKQAQSNVYYTHTRAKITHIISLCFRSLLPGSKQASDPTSMTSVTQKEDDLVKVVGFRFHPTDEELVGYYLKLKNQGQDYDVRAIAVVNVCKFEPWDLPGQSKIRSKDQVWFFFSPRDYKYKKSKRSNRTTDAGYWKPTGQPRKVMKNVTAKKLIKKQIGTKRTLVFYNGRPKGVKTEWVMHQYECAPDSNFQDQGEFVLYKLKKKSNEKSKKKESDEKTGKGEPNRCPVLAPHFQNQDPTELVTNSVIDEHQSAHHADAENECPNDVAVALSDALTNGNTNAISSMSSYERCISGFRNQISACGDGECHPMFTPTDLIQSSCDTLLHMTKYFHFENESQNLGRDCLMTSGYKNQISAEGEGERPPFVISFDFSTESPFEKGDCLFSSTFENQLSHIDFEEGTWSPPLGELSEDCIKSPYEGNKISDVQVEEGQQISDILLPSYQSTFNKGEPNSLLAHDFTKINIDNKNRTSVSEEGESSSQKMSPSDFASQNQFQKIDIQDLGDVNWDFLTDVDVQTAIAELEPELMANVAAELQCSFSSHLQGPKFADDIPYYSQ